MYMKLKYKDSATQLLKVVITSIYRRTTSTVRFFLKVRSLSGFYHKVVYAI